MSDRDFIRAAIEIATDGVLSDPSDSEIVLAVEEMVGRPIPARWELRFRPAIVAAWNRTRAAAENGYGVSEGQCYAIERSVVSYYGLC
jgi:hypothetical protein